MQTLELKIPPVAQTLLIAALMLAQSLSGFTLLIDIPGKIWIAGLAGLVGGIISLLGVLAFWQAKTTVDPRIPADASQLVNSGIYQLSRNPMYLGFLLVLIGWAVYLSNVTAFFLLPVFILYMNRFQIKPEERFMLEKFGNKYETYMAEVRRWI
ncbi:MAG: isoprenylcysteine carboxylmethyltransferase family protein [Gammaproteobacteria bacterium]|nr:isoprenylcysteine carboxylmethyltransferase family protein [Gammaproteobacteria bacterium]